MRFCLSYGIANAPDRHPDGFSPITIRATRKVPRRKDPSENCWMHIMTALPSQLPPPQEQLLLHELNHRIGNEFCCAISVVSLAAARSSDKEVKAVRGGGASPPLCGGPSRSADAGTWDPHGRGGISSQAVHGEDSKRAAGLVGLQSPRAAEIGCDQVEGRAVRAD